MIYIFTINLLSILILFLLQIISIDNISLQRARDRRRYSLLFNIMLEMLKKQDAVVIVTTADLREFVRELLAEQKMPTEEPLYSPDEFAKRKRVSKTTLWRWCKSGILKRTVIGGKVYFKDTDLTTQQL